MGWNFLFETILRSSLIVSHFLVKIVSYSKYLVLFIEFWEIGILTRSKKKMKVWMIFGALFGASAMVEWIICFLQWGWNCYLLISLFFYLLNFVFWVLNNASSEKMISVLVKADRISSITTLHSSSSYQGINFSLQLPSSFKKNSYNLDLYENAFC